MKKTLIALMALAGVAAAETTVTTNWLTLPTTKENFYSNDYAFTFMLDESFSLATSGSVLGVYFGKTPTDEAGACGIVLSESNGALTLSVGRGKTSVAPSNALIAKGTTFTFNTSYAASNPNKVTFSSTIERGVAYTLSVKGGDQAMAATLKWEGQIGTPETLTYAGNMVGGDANQFMNYAKNNGIEVVTPPVPEPTTATLSLLALAGLAARRRRK